MSIMPNFTMRDNWVYYRGYYIKRIIVNKRLQYGVVK